MSNEKYEVIERRNKETVVVPHQGGHARTMRPCHWCGKPTTQYGCPECKRNHGWEVDTRGKGEE